MYSFTLEESDFMRTKENCIKRSKMVLTVYLTFSGQKKYFGNFNILSQTNSGDDFKACLSHHFSVRCCIFFFRLTYFVEQATHTDDFPWKIFPLLLLYNGLRVTLTSEPTLVRISPCHFCPGYFKKVTQLCTCMGSGFGGNV